MFTIVKAESSKFRTCIMRHGQAVYRTEAEKPLPLALSAFQLCPSGGPFLVPPRKGERMRLKEALTAASSRRRADVSAVRLPPAIDSLDSLRDAPPSLRILPARSSFREAGFRCFLRKHPSIQHIPCQCAHWRGIEDQFDFWKRLPVAIACYRFSEFS